MDRPYVLPKERYKLLHKELREILHRTNSRTKLSDSEGVGHLVTSRLTVRVPRRPGLHWWPLA